MDDGLGRIDDPLQCAMDRGSKGLPFINSPLVMDYLDLKFSKSIPSWKSRNPFNHNIHGKFFAYGKGNWNDQEQQTKKGPHLVSNALLRYMHDLP